MKRWMVFGTLFLILAAAPSRGRAQVPGEDGMGPLGHSAFGAFEFFRSLPSFSFPRERAAGKSRWVADVDWLNYWTLHISADRPYHRGDALSTFPLKRGSLLLDMEVKIFTARFQRTFTNRVWADAEMSASYLNGGVMDGLIEGFHSAFSLSQDKRDWFPKDKIGFIYVKRDGTQVTLSEEELGGWQSGNLAVGLGVNLRRSSPSSDLRLVLKLPTTSQTSVLGSRGFDVTLQHTLGWGRGRFHYYGGLSATRYGSRGNSELDFKTVRFAAFGCAEFVKSPRTSFLLQAVWATAIARYPHLDQPIFEMTLGMRKIWKRGMVEAALLENLFFYDNTPDLGFHLAFTMPLD